MKLKKILRQFFVSLFLLSIIAFFLNWANLLRVGDIKFLHIGIASLLLVLFLSGRSKIKEIWNQIQKEKLIFILGLASLILSIVIIFVFSVFRHKSPFAYEEKIKNFKRNQFVQLGKDTFLEQKFTAKSNNLGTIGIKLIAKERNINNIRQEVSQISSDRIKIYLEIVELSTNKLIYSNAYDLPIDVSNSYYPFGFPLQEKSQNKEYLLKIKEADENYSDKAFFVEKNEEGKINSYYRYVYSIRNIKSSWKPILRNLFLGFKETFSFVYFLTIFFVLSFPIIYIKLSNGWLRKLTKIALLFIVIFLFLYQFLLFFQEDLSIKLYETKNIILLFGLSLASAIYLKKTLKTSTEQFSPSKISVIFIIIILCLSLFVYFYKLGNFCFQMDEYFHAAVIQRILNRQPFSYRRSLFTSYAGALSSVFFNFLKIKASQEFIFRTPIALTGVISALLIYFISSRRMKGKFALMTSLIFITEVWFIYFSRYLRFYMPSIAMMLFIIWFIDKMNFNYVSLLTSLIVSILCYFYLSVYFLFFTIFITFVFVAKIINDKKILLLVPILVPVVFLVIKKASRLLNSNSPYNLISWQLNPVDMQRMFDWITSNYGFFFLLSLSSLPVFFFLVFKEKNIFRVIKTYLIEAYVYLNVFFLFFYIVNVPFNFTFRPILFFLPFMFISAVTSIVLIFKERTAIIVLAMVLLSNIFSTVYFYVDEEGDQYFPTKLVYERLDFATGNKDIANFIENYAKLTNNNNYVIHYIGLGDGHLAHYLKPENKQKVLPDYRYSYSRDADLSDLLENIKRSSLKTNFVVINANAYPSRLGKTRKTEADPKFVSYIENNSSFKELYLSKDGYSRVFLYQRGL